MSDDFCLDISIPSDDDGYVLLRCPTCSTFFKITPADLKDDGLLEIICPCCGLAGESYVTEDVINLATNMAINYSDDYLYHELKKWERQFKNGPITLKAGKPPKREPETPIRSGIEALEITNFPCCQRTAKIKPLLRITGCYCPFCGVKNYEVE